MFAVSNENGDFRPACATHFPHAIDELHLAVPRIAYFRDELANQCFLMQNETQFGVTVTLLC